MWLRIVLWTIAVSFSVRSVQTSCDLSRIYRTLNGSCNNLVNPLWGAADTTFVRVVPAEYGDGLSTPSRAKSGNELPNARLLSTSLFGDTNDLDLELTLFNMQLGQIIAHDLALTRGVSDDLPCCSNGVLAPNPASRCIAIRIPIRDQVYGTSNQQCLNMIRTFTDKDLNPQCCAGRPVEQINAVSSYLDLSIVYGSQKSQNDALRAFIGGRLEVVNRHGAYWPPRHPNASVVCRFGTVDDPCYLTGDHRANQSPGLAVLQVTLMREHNRIAETLQRQHPFWSDEKLFEQARRINIAQYQYIVYYEWLPNILSRNAMITGGLIYPSAVSHVNDYDPSVNPTIINAFTTSALRYFHSEIVGRLQLISESQQVYGVTRLSNHYFNPALLEQRPGFNALVKGSATQPMDMVDALIDPEVKHFLFRGKNKFGSDLRALDIQRSRDHGLGRYNAFREYCGFPKATEWRDFGDLIDPTEIEKLRSLYETVDDVELTVAGFFEEEYPESRSDWIFHCLLIEQFRRTRQGDRFFFENDNPVSRFSLRQLQQIRNASIAKILCDNTPNLVRMQRKALFQLSSTNPLQLCSSLPAVDLSFW